MRETTTSDATDAGLSIQKLQPGEDYEAYVDRVARGVGVSSAGQGVGRFLGYATHAALAWMHGPAQLGFYALGITLVQASNVLSQLGLDNLAFSVALFVLLVSFGLGPSDRRFLASFRYALRQGSIR